MGKQDFFAVEEKRERERERLQLTGKIIESRISIFSKTAKDEITSDDGSRPALSSKAVYGSYVIRICIEPAVNGRADQEEKLEGWRMVIGESEFQDLVFESRVVVFSLAQIPNPVCRRPIGLFER